MDALGELDRQLDDMQRYEAQRLRNRSYELLKEWWAAQRRLRAAQQKHHGSDRQRAINAALRDIQGLKDHSWPILKPALEQWERKEAYLKLCLVIEQDHRMTGQEREALWLDMVIRPTSSDQDSGEVRR